jgi:hypothetical protein
MDRRLGDAQLAGSSAEAFLVSDKIESNNMLEVNLRWFHKYSINHSK